MRIGTEKEKGEGGRGGRQEREEKWKGKTKRENSLEALDLT